MSNHKWDKDTCIHCGLHREKKSWRLLMAIVNHPPFDVYKYGKNWYYGKEHKFIRPNCITR